MRERAPETVVLDELGRRFTLGPCLGKGGQGAVYAVPGSRTAVKRLAGARTRRERVEARIRAIRRLDLEGVAIARPVALLRAPDFGYVMELMADMVPLGSLLPPPGSRVGAATFREAGGLGRRLRLLARAADVLAQLHGRGLVYGDVSGGNILVSNTAAHDAVQLIDPDNLAFFSAPDPGTAYTPRYGAPEIVARRAGHGSLTDAHAFAVTACWLLRAAHPLLGDAVSEGEPEREEEALAGHWPWIDDPGDRRNATVHGIAPELVYSPFLRDLAARAFGPGLLDPLRRPGVAEWADRLHGASELVIECTECGNGFYANRPECPWCDAPRPGHLLGHVWVRDPELGVGSRESTRVGVLAVPTGTPTRIPRRHLSPGAATGPAPALEVHWDGKRLAVQAFDTDAARLVSGGRATAVAEEPVLVPARDLPAAEIHLGPEDRLHRVLSFGIRRAGP